MSVGRAQKSRNTGPELALQRELNRIDLKGYRLHHRIDLPAWGNKPQHTTPDVTYVKDKLAVYMQGCYWHTCEACGYRVVPNDPKWRKKQADARSRDERHVRALTTIGYRVLIVWEHEDAAQAALSVETILSGKHRPGVYGLK